jgi:hypothetical protein
VLGSLKKTLRVLSISSPIGFEGPDNLISSLMPEASDVRFALALPLTKAHTNEHEVKKMPRFVLTAEVEDLEKWEKGFRTHGDLFSQMAISKMEFATTEGNRITVSGETADLDAYMKVFNSPATAVAMALDGIKRETVKMFVLNKEARF